MAGRSERGNPVGRPPSAERSPEQTRVELLSAAERLLRDRGYAATSMQAVARSAGITKGTLYHHFPQGKDALVAEVGRRLLRRDRGGMAEAAEGAEGAEGKLVAMASWLLSERRRSERMLRDAVRFLPSELRSEMNEGFLRHLFERVLAVFDEGVRRGELPRHDTGFAAWSYLGLVSEFGENPGLRADPQLPRRLVALVLRGVAGLGGGAAEPRDEDVQG